MQGDPRLLKVTEPADLELVESWLVIVDYHMHLRAPDESIDHTVEAVERFVEAAAERGVDEIGFTEHVYYFEQTRSLWSLPYQLDRCHHDLEPYVDAVVEAKRRGYPVKLGLEVDHQPDLADETGRDPRAVSVGLPDRLGPLPRRARIDRSRASSTELGLKKPGARYYDWRRDAAGAAVDVLAHPDLVKFFGPELDWDWPALAGSLDGVCHRDLERGSAQAARQAVSEPGPARGRQGRGTSRSRSRPMPMRRRTLGRDLDQAIDARARGRLRDRHGLRPAASARQEPLG